MAFKRTFNAVEMHIGLPMRVVTSGIPKSQAIPFMNNLIGLEITTISFAN